MGCNVQSCNLAAVRCCGAAEVAWHLLCSTKPSWDTQQVHSVLRTIQLVFQPHAIGQLHALYHLPGQQQVQPQLQGEPASQDGTRLPSEQARPRRPAWEARLPPCQAALLIAGVHKTIANKRQAEDDASWAQKGTTELKMRLLLMLLNGHAGCCIQVDNESSMQHRALDVQTILPHS